MINTDDLTYLINLAKEIALRFDKLNVRIKIHL